MARLDEADSVYPASRAAWRRWLKANHQSSPGVWLVNYTKASGKPHITYEDLVEELLCFGWVDSTNRKIDHERSALYVAPRRKGSTWASTNKARVERLIAAGRMTGAGLAVIDRAKADGSWTILDAVEALQVPDDLAAAFRNRPSAKRRYDGLSNSKKKEVLWSVISAKKPETRAARIARIVQ